MHEGHAFIVEAAVSVGGKNIKPGLNIHRFANRIPLLFEVRGRRSAAGESGHSFQLVAREVQLATVGAEARAARPFAHCCSQS